MVRPIDISNVLQSLDYLGRSNQRLADLRRAENARKSKIGGQLGGIAGAAIGTYFGGPVGGAAGGAIGSAVGSNLAGGKGDASQMISSGQQGYQMGQQQQSYQYNQDFNTNYADAIEKEEALTDQQKEYAKKIRGSNQDPRLTMGQSQFLGIDPRSIRERSQIRETNTSIINRGLGILKNDQSQYEKGSSQWQDAQTKIENLENLKGQNLGRVNTQTLQTRMKDMFPMREKVYTHEETGKVLHQTYDPWTGKRATKSFGDAPEDDGKTPPTLSIAGEAAVKLIESRINPPEKISDDMRNDIDMVNRLSMVGRKHAKQAQKQISEIASKYEGEEEKTDDWYAFKKGEDPINLGNMTRSEALEKMPSDYTLTSTKPSGVSVDKQDDFWAVKKGSSPIQLGFLTHSEAKEKLQPGYTLTTTQPRAPKTSTKQERETAFMNRIVDNVNSGKQVSAADLRNYGLLWKRNAVKTTVKDKSGVQREVRESSFPTLESLQGSIQQQQQQRQEAERAEAPTQTQPQAEGVSAQQQEGAVTADDVLPQQQADTSPVSAAQSGDPITTDYSETVTTAERPWKRATASDYETVRSLGQYNHALNQMGDNVADMAWANVLSIGGGAGDSFAKWATRKIPQKMLDVIGVKPGAKRFVAAYVNQVLAMQQMVKGNPSDRDIAFMLESTAQLTNDPEYNKMVIDYNQQQVRSALKLKLEMMLADGKRITPEAEAIARRAGINMGEVRRAMDMSPEDVYRNNMNTIRRRHAEFASQAGENYKPKASIDVYDKNGRLEKTVLGSPAEYLVSNSGKLFEGVNYTPTMAAQIVRDDATFGRVSPEDKRKLLQSFDI